MSPEGSVSYLTKYPSPLSVLTAATHASVSQLYSWTATKKATLSFLALSAHSSAAWPLSPRPTYPQTNAASPARLVNSVISGARRSFNESDSGFGHSNLRTVSSFLLQVLHPVEPTNCTPFSGAVESPTCPNISNDAIKGTNTQMSSLIRPNAALSGCGTIVWFERRACSAVRLNA